MLAVMRMSSGNYWAAGLLAIAFAMIAKDLTIPFLMAAGLSLVDRMAGWAGRSFR